MNRLKSFVLIMVSFGLWFVGNGCDQELHLIEHQAYFLDDQTSSLVPERRQYGMKAKQERSEWVLNQLIKGPKRPFCNGPFQKGRNFYPYRSKLESLT